MLSNFSGLLFLHIKSSIKYFTGCSELGSWHSASFWAPQYCRGWKGKNYTSQMPFQLVFRSELRSTNKMHLCRIWNADARQKPNVHFWLVLLLSMVVETLVFSSTEFHCSWLAVGVLRGNCAGWSGPLVPLLLTVAAGAAPLVSTMLFLGSFLKTQPTVLQWCFKLC